MVIAVGRLKDGAERELADRYAKRFDDLGRRIGMRGLEIHDPKLRKRDDGVWEYTEPDWDELKHVVTGHGPKTQERLAFRRRFLEQEQWVRDVVLAA